ncbi:phosphonate metabolism protein/1,5-bisphosphokinase (PRPP-forming) PhnN [Parasedimentitalea maritima]|uniref:Ribose 1,5-bisphosphate phosphokinase PhnN n=1 Tax=Parasedimentitalea maritima TaxID=2578117 RepID=A0A6A4RE19_9RHOB|nr:phosphonate metabolism protein/1,5-bisphosphokinase (PRPP-forming) PhnN [Zongyanglinia marina]KAE9628590.1 phosphonate metabolism protein/1,5-bisphosphokinase (PRPP-forming) PhnN [Zongyanglinia marina]
MTGRFIAVVGPSGVGKDSVMRALAKNDVRLTLARRVITRPSGAGGEDFDGVSTVEFERRLAAGDFLLNWHAHGLQYGIPVSIDQSLNSEQDVLANLSRAVLPQAELLFERFEVLLLTASRSTLSTRLQKRGRESASEIAHRLDRANFTLPRGIAAHVVDNSGSLERTLAAVSAHLHPVSA